MNIQKELNSRFAWVSQRSSQALAHLRPLFVIKENILVHKCLYALAFLYT